jgi:hypothetical protein
MIHAKLIFPSMLSFPLIKEISTHYLIALCVLAWLGILFLVLKAFEYNKDKFEN